MFCIIICIIIFTVLKKKIIVLNAKQKRKYKSLIGYLIKQIFLFIYINIYIGSIVMFKTVRVHAVFQRRAFPAFNTERKGLLL